MINAQLTPAFEASSDPWRLLQKWRTRSKPRAIRLLVHGSADGQIHKILVDVIKQIRESRNALVEVELLTSGTFTDSSADSLWLVPLFLLPGKHVRHDIPLVRQRLSGQGVTVNLLPFLGSWPSWLSILNDFLQKNESNVARPVLLHHP